MTGEGRESAWAGGAIRILDGYEYTGMNTATRIRGMQLAAVIEYWDLPRGRVWLHCLSLGGELSECELDAYLHGAYAVSDYQHDIMAQAVNELIDMLPAQPRASFSSEPDVDRVELL